MSKKLCSGAYICQGASLVVPEGTADSQIQKEIEIDLVNRSFRDIEGIDRFTFSLLDGSAEINGIGLPDGELPAGWKAVPLRQVMNIITGENMAEGGGPIGRLFRFCHISHWRRESRFCGSCGAVNGDAENGETARLCTKCGRLEFPRITPAVIIIITNDRDETLLARNIKNVSTGMYSLIAGFNEAGESLEDTVVREIKEEVNIEVDEIKYIKSQPWPFPNSLMLGFSAKHRNGDIRPDGIEIEDAKWFSRDKLPLIPGYGSVSRYLIDLWRYGKL